MNLKRSEIRDTCVAMIRALVPDVRYGGVGLANLQDITAVVHTPNQNIHVIARSPKVYEVKTELTVELLGWETNDILIELDHKAQEITDTLLQNRTWGGLIEDIDLIQTDSTLNDTGDRRLGSLLLTFVIITSAEGSSPKDIAKLFNVKGGANAYLI